MVRQLKVLSTLEIEDLDEDVEDTGAEAAVGGGTETPRGTETVRSVQETKGNATSPVNSAGGPLKNRDVRGDGRIAATIPAARSPVKRVVT